MALLSLKPGPRNADDFPTVQLFLLAIVRLAEPIALTSIFPYAWALVKDYHIGNDEQASFYSGLLISAFSLSEAVVALWWGGLSDRIGRKPVLMIGCVGTMLSMLMVGVAPNFWVALLGRCLGGALNGNIGVIQTMVGEIVTRPEHEPRAFSIMPFVWSMGTIVGPSIGGIFTSPHESWPTLFPEGSLFERFPYLLPNVVCAAMLLVSIVLGYFLLEETHPALKASTVALPGVRATEYTPLLAKPNSQVAVSEEGQLEEYGTLSEIDENWTEKPTLPATSIKTWNKRVIALIIALCIFTYHSMTFDHLLPIFFEDERAPGMSTFEFGSTFPLHSPGGLGLTLRNVGVIMAVDGAIALFIQAFVFPFATVRFGTFQLFLIVAVLHPIIYMLMPMLLLVPESLLYPAIYGCLIVRNLLSIILYPLLMMLIKDATPDPNVLGKVNGMAAGAAAGLRMTAPPIAGFLYTMGSKIDCTALAWYGSAAIAIIGSVQCFWVPRKKNLVVVEEDAVVQKQGTTEPTVVEVEFCNVH